jgi:hypothetical protein
LPIYDETWRLEKRLLLTMGRNGFHQGRVPALTVLGKALKRRSLLTRTWRVQVFKLHKYARHWRLALPLSRKRNGRQATGKEIHFKYKRINVPVDADKMLFVERQNVPRKASRKYVASVDIFIKPVVVPLLFKIYLYLQIHHICLSWGKPQAL